MPAVVAMVFTGTLVTVWVAPVARTSAPMPVGMVPEVVQPLFALAVESRHRSPLATTGVMDDTKDQLAALVVEAHSARLAWPAPWVEVVTCAVAAPAVIWAEARPGRRSRRGRALRSMGRDS